MYVVFKRDDWDMIIEQYYTDDEEKAKSWCKLQNNKLRLTSIYDEFWDYGKIPKLQDFDMDDLASTEKDIPSGVSAIFQNCKFYK